MTSIGYNTDRIETRGTGRHPEEASRLRPADIFKKSTLSSVVEHYLHTVGVAGSNPAACTIFRRIKGLQQISYQSVATDTFVAW